MNPGKAEVRFISNRDLKKTSKKLKVKNNKPVETYGFKLFTFGFLKIKLLIIIFPL